jgi:hypothetical protein
MTTTTPMNDSMRKAPVAVQMIVGFVLLVYGAWTMLNATFWSDADPRFLLIFLSIGVLYLLNGVPMFLEGAMTMFYKKQE